MAVKEFTQRHIFGFSTGFLFLTITIASLVISVQDRHDNPSPNCGVGGHPPLRNYLLGTGCGYLLIALAYYYLTFTKSSSDSNSLPMWIASMSPIFVFAWMIVGAVSLWHDGSDCKTLNRPVWDMGMAAVIVTLCVEFLAGYYYYRVKEGDE